MRSRLVSIMFAAALTAGAALPAVAQDTTHAIADTTHPTELAPVVVSATRTPHTLTDLPVSTTILRGDEARATPALTLDDVVRTIPSLNVPFESAVVGHYTSNALSMRGLGGYVTTLVTLDGVPLNDPFSGYIQWLKVPKDLVDQVEVVRGGNSSLYGTYALGGVVNIVTRQPTTNQGEALLSYGSNSTPRGNAMANVVLSPKLRLMVNGNYYNTTGYIRPVPEDAGPIDIPAWSRSLNLFTQLSTDLSDHSSSFIRANYYNMYQNQGSPLGHDGQNVLDLAWEIENRTASGGRTSATVFYQRDVPFTYNTDPITERGVDEFVSNFHRTPANFFGASALWSTLSANARVGTTLGVDTRVVSGDDFGDVYSAPDSFAYHEVGGGTQLTGGAFAQLEYHATPAFELLGSVRFDGWANNDGHHSRTPGFDSTFANRTETSLSPKLALRYRAARSWTLRGAVYRAFNAPNLDELYRPYSAQSYANVPNPYLGPETLLGGEAGVEYTRGRGSVQANIFQNNISDVISYNPIAFDPVYTTQPVNVGSVRTRGVEVFGSWNVARAWRLSASYTYTESIITDNPPDTTVVGNTQGDTPKHQASASLGYVGGRSSVYLRGRYVGERYMDISNTRQIDSYFVADLSASLAIGPRLEAFLEVQNLLDALYVVSEYGFDARGTPRQIFAGFQTRLAWGQ